MQGLGLGKVSQCFKTQNPGKLQANRWFSFPMFAFSKLLDAWTRFLDAIYAISIVVLSKGGHVSLRARPIWMNIIHITCFECQENKASMPLYILLLTRHRLFLYLRWRTETKLFNFVACFFLIVFVVHIVVKSDAKKKIHNVAF
jgi:hypothetical protein